MRSLKAVLALVVLLATTAVHAAPAAITGFAGYVKARPTPSTMTGTEVLPLVQSGTTTALPLSGLAAYVAKSVTPASIGAQPTLGYTPLNKAGDTMTGSLQLPTIALGSTGSTGDVSQTSALTFGNAFTKAASIGGGNAATLATLLNATYALANGSDTTTSYTSPMSSSPYPFPIFAITPVTSEYQTHAAVWDHVVDNPNEDRRVFAHAYTYETNTGLNAPSLSSERVNTYLGIRGYAGAGAIWAGNSQTHLFPGYTGTGAVGWEFDVTNQAQHRGDGFGQVPYTALNSSGVSVNTLSKFRNAEAYFVDGKLEDGTPGWNRGYVVYNGSINASWGCSFCDYGGSYATLQSYGAHTHVIDLTNSVGSISAVALPAGVSSGVPATLPGSALVNWLYNGVPVAGVGSDTAGNVILNASSFRTTGPVTAKGVITSQVPFAEDLTTPSSSSAPCNAGQFTDDANYHYVCTATNKWRRVALSDF